jgi:osmotically-inducible protein OsmY
MKADTQLQTDVRAELQNNSGIDAAHICIEAKNGMLALSGEVETTAEKLDVERIAQAVTGVMAFSSEIFVMQPGLSHRCDAEIAIAAENVLRWMSFATTHPIKVEVEAGLVTLSGELDLEYQRRAVLAAVRNIVGVSGISDYILVDVHHDANTRELVANSAHLLSSAILPSTSLPSAAISA